MIHRTEAQRIGERTYARRRYAQNKVDGICVRCRLQRAVKGLTQCEECREYGRMKDKERWKKNPQEQYARTRKWLKAHPEKEYEYRLLTKEWMKKNKKKLKGYQKTFKKRNPLYWKEYYHARKLKGER